MTDAQEPHDLTLLIIIMAYFIITIGYGYNHFYSPLLFTVTVVNAITLFSLYAFSHSVNSFTFTAHLFTAHSACMHSLTYSFQFTIITVDTTI